MGAMRWAVRVVPVCGVAFAMAACSLSGTSAAPGPAASEAPDTGTSGCKGEGETYTADMVKPGTLGKYTFTLTAATPAPPGLLTNVWTVKIVDSDGKAPDVSQLTAVPFMPQMGHGSDQTPTLAANADGTFTVSDLYLFMDGLWTVTFTVSTAGATPTVLDKAVYSFCLDG